jgi:signal transduction histidine kinase
MRSGTVDTSGRHLLHLINDLLDLGVVNGEPLTLELETVPVARVARRAVDMMRPQAERRGVRVEFVDGSNGLELRADERRLRQVLLNLLDNALKFTDPGGSVGLQTWSPGPAWVSLAVWDTGIGTTRRTTSEVFEPFTRSSTHARSPARRF